jgi:hypothetical protein
MIHQSARRLNSIHQSARRLKSIHQKVDSPIFRAEEGEKHQVLLLLQKNFINRSIVVTTYIQVPRYSTSSYAHGAWPRRRARGAAAAPAAGPAVMMLCHAAGALMIGLLQHMQQATTLLASPHNVTTQQRKQHNISRWMVGANFPSHNLPGGGCLPLVLVNYSDPAKCQASCDRDPKCKEWTFGEGHPRMCCHKDCKPNCPVPDDCPNSPCVSGVKDPSNWPAPRPPPPLPPAPAPPLDPACRGLNRLLALQVANYSAGIPWQLGNYAVRQTNCVFLERRFWCYADVVPFASKLYPNTYNTSTHLFSASVDDLVFTYEHEVIPRGPAGSWDHGGAQTPGAAIAADGTVVVVYCGFAQVNRDAQRTTPFSVANHVSCLAL